MSQHDLEIANQGFPATRADLNNALQALGSTNSGATAPSTTYANQLWYDTANNILKIRNEDNDAWISVLYLDQTNDAITQFDVDNIRIDGNTISSTDTNGDITLDPNGTGGVTQSSGTYTIKNADGDSNGLKILQDTSDTSKIINHFGGPMVFGTNNTERMRIDSSGNVGIGTTATGDAELIVYGDDAGTIYKNSTTGTGGADGFYVGLGKSGGTDAYVYQRENTNLIFGTNNTERMRIDSSGNVRINNTSNATFSAFLNILKTAATNATIHSRVPGSYASSHIIFGNDTSDAVGSIDTNGSATSYNTSSDYRLKENVADMTGAIDRVKALAPKRFNFIADPDDTTVDGFLAHEAQTVVPEAITGTHNEVELWTQDEIDAGDAPDGISAGDNKLDDDGNTIPVMQGIDQSKLVPLLTGALQEAIAKIESLETRVAALEG